MVYLQTERTDNRACQDTWSLKNMESIYCFQNAKNRKELALYNKKKWQCQEIWWKGFIKSALLRLHVVEMPF